MAKVDGNVTEESFKSVLDENSELINFNWSEPNSGVTKSSFMFDGVNDYIKVKYDDSLAYNSDGTPYLSSEDSHHMTKKEILKENGLTFEFYGVLEPGNSYKLENGELTLYDNEYNGVFGYWNGNEKEQCGLRFGTGIFDYENVICWNYGAGGKVTEGSEFAADPSNLHNNFYKIPNLFGETPHYLAVSIDTSKVYEENSYRLAIYVDDEPVKEGKYPISSWETFEEELEELNYFCIGRCSFHAAGYWHYSKMNCYALRLYNRGLTDEEIRQSIEDTKKYHKMLENE